MGVAVDFTVSAENVTWKGPLTLTPTIPGKRFQTEDTYYPGTLLVMIRGLPVARDNDDGYTEIDDQTFEMKETYTGPLDWLMVGYVRKIY